MSQVYLLCCKESLNSSAYSVFSRNDLGLAHEIIPLLDGKKELAGEFYFKKISVKSSGLDYSNSLEDDPVWQDYPPNQFAWPILSEKLKDIILSNTSEVEDIDFIKICVTHFGKTNPYYILRFNKLIDIIDRKNTLYVKNTDHIIRPCFKETIFDTVQIAVKPASHNLWKITSEIYVSDLLKRAIINSKIDGIEFEKVRSK